MLNYTKTGLVNFVFLYKTFSFLSLMLLFSLKKIIIRFRYGLYYYFFWLKTGCKNIKWKSTFTVFFLLDFIFASSVIVNMYNFSITKFTHNILPVKKNNFTVSKGPMVRKKQSRVQYSFKQIFLNVTKVMHACNKNFKFNVERDPFFNKLQCLLLVKEDICASRAFPLLNYNVIFFLLWVKQIKSLNFNIETNFFFLKKKNIYVRFHDVSFFNINL